MRPRPVYCGTITGIRRRQRAEYRFQARLHGVPFAPLQNLATFNGAVLDPYEWTPFGGGVRRCLGMSFALFEMKTIIATVLSRARLRIENPDARLTRHGFFLIPEGGPRVALDARC